MSNEALIHIETLGHQGDGIGESASGEALYVPFTLPGETVRVSGKGVRQMPTEIVSASAERIEPFCDHFTRCGGCQLQHMVEPAYLRWKTGLLAAALEREGIETPL